jgi:pyruvate dehydrogenase E2 component (dihydrolipoamide acetyltransferase)
VAYEFKLPDLGEGLTEGEIARWLVAEGDEIAEDAPLVEIATDKTTVEIPSPAAGRVARILVSEGAVVPVGTMLVVIGDDDAASTQAEPAQRVQATPLVRKLAQELGVDLAAVAATGSGGRLTEEDVRAAASPREGRRERVRGVRRQIAEHLARAPPDEPAGTYFEHCDNSN